MSRDYKSRSAKVSSLCGLIKKIYPITRICNSCVKKDGANYIYHYIYRDHLGNNRLVYADLDGNGVINPATEIIEENNYYPFGLKHQGYNNLPGAGYKNK